MRVISDKLIVHGRHLQQHVISNLVAIQIGLIQTEADDIQCRVIHIGSRKGELFTKITGRDSFHRLVA